MDPAAATTARRGRPQGARLRTSPPRRSSEGRSHLRPTSQHAVAPPGHATPPSQPPPSCAIPPSASSNCCRRELTRGSSPPFPRGAPCRCAPHLQRNGGGKERRKGKGKGESERGGRYGIGLVTGWLDRKFGNLGFFYIFTIIKKVTRWFSTLKWAPTDLALL